MSTIRLTYFFVSIALALAIQFIFLDLPDLNKEDLIKFAICMITICMCICFLQVLLIAGAITNKKVADFLFVFTFVMSALLVIHYFRFNYFIYQGQGMATQVDKELRDIGIKRSITDYHPFFNILMLFLVPIFVQLILVWIRLKKKKRGLSS